MQLTIHLHSLEARLYSLPGSPLCHTQLARHSELSQMFPVECNKKNQLKDSSLGKVVDETYLRSLHM
jgi:hypothetical protein